MENKIIKAKLNDTNGKGNASMFIEDDNMEVNIPNSYVLANKPHNGKVSRTRQFITGNPNVGRGSNGFASVITLATIITILGALVAFFTLRY